MHVTESGSTVVIIRTGHGRSSCSLKVWIPAGTNFACLCTRWQQQLLVPPEVGLLVHYHRHCFANHSCVLLAANCKVHLSLEHLARSTIMLPLTMTRRGCSAFTVVWHDSAWSTH